MKTLHSRDNPTIKQLLGLSQSARERKKTGKTVLDGAHLVDAYLTASRIPDVVLVRQSAMESADVAALQQQLAKMRVDLTVVADALLAEASQLDSPAAVMAIVETPTSIPVPADADAVLVLDNVQDPGNVGALLRCAAAFGFKHALLGAGTAFAWSPKVLRAAQGAHFVLNIAEGDLVTEFIARYQGSSLAFVPTARGAQPLHAVDLCQPVAILVGNEGAGLSTEVLAMATRRVTIPMPGEMESLNAASCGAVAMYELSRQRMRRP